MTSLEGVILNCTTRWQRRSINCHGRVRLQPLVTRFATGAAAMANMPSIPVLRLQNLECMFSYR